MSQSKEFRKDIAGLRAVAVLLVIAFHLGTFVAFDPSLQSSYFLSFLHENLKAGFLGVDIFFVISGFLMTSIIFNKVLSPAQNISQTKAIWNFWKARAKRICPALLVAVIVFFLITVQLFEPHRFAAFAREVRYALVFISNFLYSRAEGYFAESSLEKVLLHTWSLAVEWQFYLIYPIVLVIFCRFFGLAKTKTFVLGLTVVAALYTLLAPMSTKSYYMLQVRAWELLLGGVVYLYPCTIQSSTVKKYLQLAGLVAVISSVFIAEQKPIWDFATPSIAVIGSALVIWSNCKNILLDNPVAQYLGNISYSLYIYHWPVLVILSLTLLLNPIAALAIIFALSCLSYHLVEKTRAYGYKFLVAYIAIAVLNLQVAKSHGWEWRIEEQYYDTKQHNSLFVEKGTFPQATLVNAAFQSIEIQDNSKIWLIGDSHASHFYKLLKPRFKDELSVFAHHGVLSIADLAEFDYFHPQQSLINDSILDIKNTYTYLQNKKNRLIIIISQRWIVYKEHFYQQQKSGYVCMLNNEPCENYYQALSFEDALYNNLEKLIQKLSNADFIIVGSLYPIKEFKSPLEFAHLKHMPLSKLYAWYYQNYGLEQFTKNFKYQNIDLTELKKIDTVFKRLEQKYNNVHFYDVREKLCEGNHCRTLTDDGQLIFFDDDHLSKAGAEFVGQGLVQKIQATLKQ